MLVNNSNQIARSPELEEVYKGHLLEVLAETGSRTDFFRYYIDGKSGVGYSTAALAMQQAKEKVDKSAKLNVARLSELEPGGPVSLAFDSDVETAERMDVFAASDGSFIIQAKTFARHCADANDTASFLFKYGARFVAEECTLIEDTCKTCDRVQSACICE